MIIYTYATFYTLLIFSIRQTDTNTQKPHAYTLVFIFVHLNRTYISFYCIGIYISKIYIQDAAIQSH